MGFDEAVARLPGAEALLGTEIVPLDRAAGRVLAEPLYARRDSPHQATSAMDGYAVRDATTAPDHPLRVIGESRAGLGFPGIVGAGEAVRIFTGAPMPAGTDRCIVQEHASREGGTVMFTAGYGPGWHVRAIASDFAAGALLLDRGTRLSPQAMVAAAATDVASVTVAVPPRVAILGTGDELAAPGTAANRPGAIPESVSFGVAAMVEEAGGVVVRRATGRDDLPALQHLAGSLLEAADLVIVTGGASVGDHDLARPMFAPHELELLIDKVAIKPGKPVWLGRAGGRWVLGLPGNPTSALVTAALFLRPLLAALQGQDPQQRLRWRRLPLVAPLPVIGARETFVRAQWEEDGLVPLDSAQSGAQAALAAVEWLIRRPASSAAAAAGETVSALAF
ncbi:MAG: molybdopterin molybdotransferase MoeA [Sphingomonadales bacterium]|nr:molybdopterin molybdotransferase MoeA [Sphingomonadales bacterium]